jgi:hypothetical protein
MKFKVDKVYVITIDKSHESVRNIINKVKNIDLPNKAPIEIVGINGWDLTNEDLKSKKITPYNKWNLNYKDNLNQNKWHNRDITKGEIGCALSHIQIWEDAYKNKYENIIILEDDFHLLRAIDWSDIDDIEFDLLYLGRSLQICRETVWDDYFSETFCKPGMSNYAGAYILSKEGLKKIVEFYLDKYKTMVFPLDNFLASTYSSIEHRNVQSVFPFNEKIINALAFNRNIIYQRGGRPSQTEPKENDA